jgi:hypothetical protein
LSHTLEKIKLLPSAGDVRISEHGYDELAADGLSTREVIDGLGCAIVVEDYPSFHKGPCVLVLQRDANGPPVHVVWGIPRGNERPAVLVTAYRPDPLLWDESFTVRFR